MINKKKAIYIVAGVAVVLCVVGYWFARTSNFLGSDVVIDPNIYYPVYYVVDGDTFKVEIGGKVDDSNDVSKIKNYTNSGQQIITVRVLGINTPETVDPRKPVECYGPQASSYAKDILNGRKVKLIFNPNREQKDKYGRYLAYVYRDDGLFYNEAMIKEGYAREYTFGTPYSMQKEFRAIESVAQKAQRGLWGVCVKASK